ncbi:hypothetical protein ES703_34436 [subsurface metagenome]
MQTLPFSDLLFLKHTVNTCIHFGRHYHFQSRNTQRAGILKRFGVAISIPTFDRAIRRSKDRYNLWKQHRSGSTSGVGYAWKTSLTILNWKLVMFMWKLGQLTREQFEALKRIFGMIKKRGPVELRAPQALTEHFKGDLGEETFIVPN